MCQVIEKYAVLQMIEAMGFCRFLFRKYGYDIERGVILVVEDTWQAGEIADAFCEAGDAVLIKRKRNEVVRPLNFQIGLHLYGKSDREDWITEFLIQKDFFPVVIVAGMVPEPLYGRGYIFRLDLTGVDIFEFSGMYQKMVTNVMENLEAFLYELKNLKTSKIFGRCYMEKYPRASQIVAATGITWRMVLRNQNAEETVEDWLEDYCSFLIKSLQAMDDFEGKSGVREAIGKCIIAYMERNNVQILSLDEFSSTNKAIFMDYEHYYFAEALLKEICTPLTDTISFLQLKSEMYAEGILECNEGSKQNYTIKVTCLDTVSKRYIRKRFLKLKRECLLTDSGMPLEDQLVLPNDEEVNENVDKDWSN